MSKFTHKSENLTTHKKVVFTAQSAKNFHQRMLICAHALENDVVPINPFTNFGYFLYELVDRDAVRNANNNLLQRCDELWVYGDISDGVLAEIKMIQKTNKPIRYFDISGLPDKVKEVSISELTFEENISKHKKEFT